MVLPVVIACHGEFRISVPFGGPISAVVCVCGRGAFGEIALPRRCLGEVSFAATPSILAVVDIFKLRIIV